MVRRPTAETAWLGIDFHMFCGNERRWLCASPFICSEQPYLRVLTPINTRPGLESRIIESRFIGFTFWLNGLDTCFIVMF